MGVYEHRLVAETLLDRALKEGEVVHHLDSNRSNNSPDNLLVMLGPMHGKLHAWLDKHTVIPKSDMNERLSLGCVRCKVCNIPIYPNQTYCSLDCQKEVGFDRYKHPTKEELEKLLWEKPTTKIAKDLGVSDVAVGKLARKLGVEKPPRGYWRKVELGLIPEIKSSDTVE